MQRESELSVSCYLTRTAGEINVRNRSLPAIRPSMINFDTSSMLFVAVWSLAAVAVGLTCGYFIGRWHTLNAEPKQTTQES